MIILYDISSLLPEKAWSPSTWKTRYCLNYKRIPYRTEWIEFCDIEPTCISLGIAPAGVRYEKPHYTFPVIHDTSNGFCLADSAAIAEYLDEKYPDTPAVFPRGTAALQHAFLSAHSITLQPLWCFFLPVVPTKLSSESREYYIRKHSAGWGKSLLDIGPTGDERVQEWRKVKQGFDVVDGWLQKNGNKGTFIMGELPIFVDFVVGGFLTFLRSIFGEESEEWRDIISWHDGRWERFLEALKEYQDVV
ncbi:hypothetical protein BDQ12DRAFT_635314 [Crucibulum laeve]|uniref:GST N-terminal domain-containing protein n=1 Tax=Crucibulum laeve TaxID=68775 RepID=A0A5C3LR95_9AGAR|nr:hypothetical protein BDQ12DRAFT_635314 [Crucibulum laeve]